MNEVVTKQFDAIEAQMELLRVMVATLRHSLRPAPQVALVLPTHCDGVPETLCALRDDDARIDKASLPRPNAWVCRGCSVYSEDGLTT